MKEPNQAWTQLQKTHHPPLLSAALALMVSASLGVNFVLVETSPPIYSGHLVVLLFCVFVYLKVLVSQALNSRPLTVDIKWLVFFSMLAIYSLAGGLMAPPRFFPEVTKFLFTLFTTYALILVFKNYKISLPLIAASIAIGTTIASATFIANYNILLINPENRLEAGTLGGYNVFGFIVANAMLAILFLLRERRSLLDKILLALTMPVLATALLLTFSRNAMLVFFLGGFLFMLLSRSKTLLWTALATFLALSTYTATVLYNETDLVGPIVSRYFSDDLLSGSGSGRSEIWANLFAGLLQSPVALTYGTGFGSIVTEVTGGSTMVNSAHNQFLEFWVYIGLIGLLSIAYMMAKVSTILLRSPPSLEKALLVSVSAQILVVLFFDSHLQASQTSWLFGLWLAIIIGQEKSITKLALTKPLTD